MKKTATTVATLLLAALFVATGWAQDKGATQGKKVPEIYLIKDRNALSGVTARSALDSRRNIRKALPVKQKKDVVIGLVPCTLDNPYYVARDKAAQDTASKYGYTVKIISSNFDIAQQTKAVETFVTQKVDVLIIDPVDAPSAENAARYAVQHGIPVVGVGNALEWDANIITTILANQYENGFENGVYAAQQFNKKHIKCVVILGQMGYSVADSRVNGMIGGIVYQRSKEMGKTLSREDAMLKGYNLFLALRDKGKFSDKDTDFEVSGFGEGGWTEEGGLKAGEDLLTASHDANLILAENDFMGIGAIRAIQNASLTPGKGGILVACAADGSKAAFELIKKGKMLSTGYNCPFMAGKYAVELIHMIFEEGYDANNMPIETSYQPYSINATNIDKFYDRNSDFAQMQDLKFKTIDQLVAAQ